MRESAHRFRSHGYVQLGKYDMALQETKEIRAAELENLVRTGKDLYHRLQTATMPNIISSLVDKLSEISPYCLEEGGVSIERASYQTLSEFVT